MTLAPYHPLYVMLGADRRSVVRGGIARGAWRWGDQSGPATSILHSLIPPNQLGFAPGAQLAPTNTRPYCVAAAPYTVDGLGNAYPAGTVFVVFPSASAGGTLGRNPGNTSASITTNLGTIASGVPFNLVYRISGIPSTASGTITITDTVTHAVLSTYSIPAGSGASIDLRITEIIGAGNVVNLVSSWTGGVPVEENFQAPPQGNNFTSYVAVPGALPAAYTQRLASDCDRGGSFGYRTQSDRRRMRAGPNCTYETIGLMRNGSVWQDSYFGIPAQGLGAGSTAVANNVWISGALRNYAWYPIAQGQQTYGCSGAYIAAASFSAGSVTVLGFNAAKVAFVYTKNTADPGPSDHVTFSVIQDGSTIFTQSATGAAIKTMAGATLSITVPSHGTTTTFQVTGSGSSSSSVGAWTITGTVTGAPRCDIPFPFTCVGPGNMAAPGGYLPAFVTNVTNQQPLTRLASGVLSQSLSAKACLAFLPTVDAWYQVTLGATAQSGIGEDPFGLNDQRKAMPGHAGRPFYAKLSTAGTQTATLQLYTPPSPTAVVSSGTVVTCTTQGGWGWASLALPASGTYRVSFCCQDFFQMESGLDVGYSLTDPTVVNPSGRTVWEPLMETYLIAYSGGSVLNTPPVSPTGNQSYLVGTTPTGAWIGHANQLAIWDTFCGVWQFKTPNAGSILAAGLWFDGQIWHNNLSDPQTYLLITVTQAQTVYLRIGPYCTDFGQGGTVLIVWSSA